MNPPSPVTQAARPRNLLFFYNPRLWPQWPFLPVVRRRPDSEEEHGVLYDARGVSGRLGYSATVFLSNYFLLPTTEDEFLALPKEVFDSAEEIADAAWSVD
jgi:hypothetical protein